MKINSIKTLILGVFFLFVTLLVSAQPSEPEKPIYSQRVSRLHSALDFSVTSGDLSLNERDLVYMPKNQKGRGSFSLKYDEIRSVKKRFTLIFPNAIVITDMNHARYRLGTYKRRKRTVIKDNKYFAYLFIYCYLNYLFLNQFNYMF
jgi:hypothetical protein